MNIESNRARGCSTATLVIIFSALASGCGSSQTASSSHDPGASGATSDTPLPADGQCNFVNYHHDEAKSANGPGKCASDCDCDGMRSCTAGACQGTARPETLNAASCNDKSYRYQEAWTPAGAGKCSGDCECDGTRKCENGACTGTAR